MNPNTPITSSEPLDQLMRRLEERGIQRTTQLLNSTVASIPITSSSKTIVSPTPEKAFEQMITNTVQNIPQQSILSIMKEGETEFIKQTGRPMTYSEMRQMYG
jgi:hypothetical protein